MAEITISEETLAASTETMLEATVTILKLTESSKLLRETVRLLIAKNEKLEQELQSARSQADHSWDNAKFGPGDA